MAHGLETVRCFSCRQMNRYSSDAKKAGTFTCGSCGKPLVIVVSGKPKKSVGNLGPLLAIVLVAAAIYGFSVAHKGVGFSSVTTSAPNPAAAPAAGQKPSNPPATKQAAAPDSQRPQAQAPPKKELAAVVQTVPTQSLEIPDSALLPKAQPAPPSQPPQAANPPAPKYVTAAPGCPEKLLSEESAKAECNGLDQATCSKRPICSWYQRPGAVVSNANDCSPRAGSYVSSRPLELMDRSGPLKDLVMESTYPEAERALANGNRLSSNGKLDRAIAEYSNLLKSSPDFPQALSERAAVYERKGDKARALADYCRVLVVLANVGRRLAARERIAALSGMPGLPVHGAVRPSPIATENPLKALPLPRTGDIQPRRGQKAIAPLNIETDAGANYFIKLVNRANARDQIWIFIKGGERYSTKVPLGEYNLRAATGAEWYGREELFGPATRFFRLRSKRGSVAAEVEILRFSRTGNQISGMTLVFKPVQDGNMEQETMSRADFDAN